MRIGRSLAIAMVAATVLPCWGCGLAPHDFRKIQPPEPLVRARSVGQDGGASDEQAMRTLVARLDDEDPVVRLAANEELRKRTGRDFGYVAWASDEERAGAVSRWRAYLAGPSMPAAAIQPTERTAQPAKAAPQSPSRRERRRRARTQPASPPATAPATAPTPPPTENAPS